MRGWDKKHYLYLMLLGALLWSSPLSAQKKKRKKKKQKIETVISTAQSYIGTPYKYGGMSRSGIDCSGLIYQSYKAAGISIPRTAKAQSKSGKSKGWDNVKIGDIVFFKFKEKRDKWWHSGVVSRIDKGNIYFIHASSSRGVVESNLMSNYYQKNVKRFRRYIR